MASKLRVKLGRLELDFEGSEDFIKQELMTVLERVRELGAAIDSKEDDTSKSDGDESKKKSNGKGGLHLTTSTLATTLGVTSGPELVIAALARLCMVDGAEKASRNEIITEMRSATAYFNENYVGNLTSALKSLIKSKRINDLGSNNYSLTAAERTALEPKIAAA